MYTCKICGRKFKSIKALGGHTSSAHPGNPGAGESETNSSEPSEVQPEDEMSAAEPEDESEAADIRQRIAHGYNYDQLTRQFGYDPRSVRRQMDKVIPPAAEGESAAPVVYKQTEVLNPEVMLRRYLNGSYEDELEFRGMMKLRASILLANELANIQKTMAEAEAKRLEPVLKVLREGREELDAAAARARGQSFEMAQEAAEGAVGRVLGYIDQKLPKGPPPRDANELITKRIDKLMEFMEHTMESRMFPQQVGTKAPEGWEYEGPPGQPHPSSQASPQPQPQGTPPQGALQPHQDSPPGWAVEREQDENEEKEESSDG
jgi:hypothetical protein